MTAVAHKVSVGDELAFDVGGHRIHWQISKVTRVTPTGRITCGPYKLNADLTIRGKTAGYHGPYEAVPATDEIRAQIADKAVRGKCVTALHSLIPRNLTTDQLRRLAAIIEE